MDPADFDSWYRAEHSRLVNSLFLLSGSLDAARDATDEAFVRALESWAKVGIMQSRTGWTYRVATNALRRGMRRRAHESTLLRRAGSAATVPPEELPDPRVWAAVRQLRTGHRQVIVLRYVADLTEDDIATALGRQRGTVASDLSRARAELSRLLQDHDRAEEAHP